MENHLIKKKWVWVIIGSSSIILLIGFRIYLPTLVLNYVNKSLSNIPDYKGQVEDVDIHLWRGAYQIDNIELVKTEGNVPVPFFFARRIDFSLDWHSLFRGNIVGEIAIIEPQLNFVKGPTKPESQIGVEKEWREVVKDLMRIDINRFEVIDGEVHYFDFSSNPKVDVFINNIEIIAENLMNRSNEDELLPSSLDASGNSLGGKMEIHIDMDPLNKIPTFDLSARVDNLDLVKLNDFLKAYGNFDVEKGTFSLYAEAAAKDGKFTGYTKPFFKDLEIFQLNKDKKEGNLLQTLWEALAGGTSEVVENQKKEQIATKVPLSGNFDDPNVDLWATIGTLMRNAFIRALLPTLDYTVNISAVTKNENFKDTEKGNKTKKEIRNEKREERR